jgi:hypothetical protein
MKKKNVSHNKNCFEGSLSIYLSGNRFDGFNKKQLRKYVSTVCPHFEFKSSGVDVVVIPDSTIDAPKSALARLKKSNGAVIGKVVALSDFQEIYIDGGWDMRGM